MSTMVPMYGFGGGIDNLRFRVYAATSLPASGRENDVCIITSTPISWWEVFPVTPTWISENGHVYIQNDPAYSGDYPNVNIIKKNGCIWLYLVRCWQYENGTWSSKDAYQYRNGAWVQFSTTFRATIHITYPAGSVCTATDGTTTLTAPDTSGTWDCVVPNAGTWTIKFVDGETEFYSKDIDITENEQSANVAPVFLYYYGNECTGITGGWTFGTNTWEESNRFKMQQKSGDYASRVTSNNSVNLSGKTLYVDVKDDSVSSSQSCFNFYVNNGYFSLTYIPVSGRNVMQIDTTNSNKGTIALEYAGKVRDYTSICYVYRMWLE